MRVGEGSEGEGREGEGRGRRQLRAHICWANLPPRERGDSHVKGAGMLVVSLRGVNFRFWSHLVCSGENAIILSRDGLV